MNPFLVLSLISAGAIRIYSLRPPVPPSMEVEFERNGPPKLRTLTAVLEIIGALGPRLGSTPRRVARQRRTCAC